MEIPLRAALLAWLAADPALSGELNAIVEEAPSRAALPWLAVATSASADWSVKDRPGREVRIALELHGQIAGVGGHRSVGSHRSVVGHDSVVGHHSIVCLVCLVCLVCCRVARPEIPGHQCPFPRRVRTCPPAPAA